MTKGIPSGARQTKQLSQSSPSFAEGGHNNHMCGKYGSGAAQPGSMVNTGKGTGKFAAGGSTHMLSGNPVRKQTPA